MFLIFYMNFLILFSLIKNSNLTKISELCKHYKGLLVVKNFDQFADLNISSCYSNESNIRIILNRDLILNKDLKIDLLDRKFIELNGIEFYHLKGIDIITSIFVTENKLPLIYIKNSNFIFYNKNKKIGSNDCNSAEIFNSFDSLFLIYSSLLFTDGVYTQKVCTLIYKNAFIKKLIFEYFMMSSIRENHLKFSQTRMNNFSLNSIIESVSFNEFYRINADYNILNDQVFKFVKEIYFEGILNKIQIDLFENFYYIEKVFFKLHNLKEFIHQGLIWLNNLHYSKNDRIKIALKNDKRQLQALYEYPNEDWCYLKKYINKKQLQFYADLNMYEDKTPSCVLLGKLKIKSFYKNYSK